LDEREDVALEGGEVDERVGLLISLTPPDAFQERPD
jgi:hypothetical protein